MLKKIINAKKGFTLVEVIVVLVIIAILAAILIPALIGYIDKANEKKIISEARSFYMAAQTVISEKYGENKISDGSANAYDLTEGSSVELGNEILNLAELTKNDLEEDTGFYVQNGKIAVFQYVKGEYIVTFEGENWNIEKNSASDG